MSTNAETGPPDTGTSGPILFRALFQYFLQGVVLSQGCADRPAVAGAKIWSVQTDREDRVALRIYVLALVLLSILQTILETYKVWHEVIDQHHWYMSSLHWSEFLLNGLICTFCEAFLIRRCWKITGKNNRVILPLATLSFAMLVANVYLAVRIDKLINVATGYADPLKAGHWAFPFWVFGSLVLSLTLTSILSWCLYKSKVGISQADELVQTIINVTWETAALPTASTIVAAAFYCSRQLTRVRHLDLFFILLTAKLYTLGILRTLNLRVRFRERLASHDLGGRQSLSDYQWDSDAPARTGSTDTCVGPHDLVSPKTTWVDRSRSASEDGTLPI
ncbi:hypothetical protein DAEQUDRAFT_763701 [Daedalea quercina L-15889]|uniref:DUF6534 domain-containing protein n=1 Tax=Daedalea quercina L-15889 TaxID=1314783 RepID=A0A165S327_9APHY|nr:hypothetical protein DAEQUDRAFT_763701 [Daedalea quercina L-15889]